MAEEPLRIVQRTAQALGLPLLSLEIELGPSQVEAVFDATDALTAADNMVLFRSAVKQALRRAGYHATFMCRPPFPEHHVQRLAPAPVAGGPENRRQPVHARSPAAGSTPGRRAIHAVGNRRAVPGRPAGACARHDGVLHAHHQRLRALPAQRAGAAIRAVGPRQPRRHAARGRPVRRQQHAHREPPRRAGRQSLPLSRLADPRRAGRHHAASRRRRPPTRPMAAAPEKSPPAWARRWTRCKPTPR
jgi:hypothetical protein